ncbi:MAG: M28 family peptidase [Anaerolineaceae bacterium]|nr:M28 family peptidase [Anaerolineaceae bacterium]
MNEKNVTWNDLLVFGGFLFEPLEENRFDLSCEKAFNLSFLVKLLCHLRVDHVFNAKKLQLNTPVPTRQSWIECLKTYAGKGDEGTAVEKLQLENLDAPIIGVVRQLIRLGIRTTQSCGGHERGGQRKSLPYLKLACPTDLLIVKTLFNKLGFWSRITRHQAIKIFEASDRLYDLGLALSKVEDILPFRYEINQVREKTLEELLSIPGETYHEEKVREYVLDLLPEFMDKVWADEAGNVLGIKNCGIGPVILISAHMDIREPLSIGSKLLKLDGIWERDIGILGADDRAGMAIIFNILKDLNENLFQGTLKVAFTVEEEQGQIGAKFIEKNFFEGVDYAISLDRRNGSDVVNKSRFLNYGSEDYSNLFERASMNLWNDQHRYSSTEGGVSDLRVWSQMGIESVNLSIGFYNEHTDKEYLNLEEWHRVHDLVLMSFDLLYREYQSMEYRKRIRNIDEKTRNSSVGIQASKMVDR